VSHRRRILAAVHAVDLQLDLDVRDGEAPALAQVLLPRVDEERLTASRVVGVALLVAGTILVVR
jgi:hypothetical protein